MMDQASDSSTKQGNKSEDSVSRAHSQDPLDTSSASSLSFFAEQNDAQHSGSQGNDLSLDVESSPKASMGEALKSEKAFIEFVMSLPSKEVSEHHKSADSVSVKHKIPVASSSTSKVGLDHLDNLCKLMEQLSELRETNNKLQKRVQYLEDLKTLHDMHKEICEEGQYSSEDALESKPRAYELKKSATESCCPMKEEMPASRSPSKYLSRRSRTQSSGGERRERSKSVGHEDASEDTKSKRLFPRWSRVKEAFGWESERKDSVKTKDDCGLGSIRSPRRCSDETRQYTHHPVVQRCSNDYLLLQSSSEDVHEVIETEEWKRNSLTSEKNIIHLETPFEGLRRQKSTPSPGSEKFPSARETAEMKPKSYTIERDTYSRADFEKEDGKRMKSAWGRVKTIIERRRDSLKRRSLRRDHPCGECEGGAIQKNSESSETLDFRNYADYVECLPRQADSVRYKPGSIVVEQEANSGPRTPSSSPTFHRKSRWMRVKKVLKGKREEDKDSPSMSTPASPSNAQDGHFNFDAIEEISQDSYEEGREISRVGSDSHVHQLGMTAPACELMIQLQRNLSEDFHKKIQEWERMRASGNTSCSPHWDRKPSETARSRKKLERYDKSIKPKLKDLTWLEKELQKIEKEKQRLSKERQKYEERALRLEKLKETVLSAKNSSKREVLVRTSAGEFRFEGISDAFTKKLYEWETKRGLGPELSTIALLDSSRLTVQSNMSPKAGALQRVVSRSESSIADIGQPSHNSSNSLPSLKLPDSLEIDRQNQPSRSNSEPDLSTLEALANGKNASAPTMTKHVDDSLEDEIAASEVNKESEEDELDKKRNDSETYYGLLEENVILLEQLKDKEEICRRLEKELEVLDKKVDVMNAHHVQETERYREKLWEMHKPGATPRDVQCCLHTMAQLRKRIETLEKCTEKLKNDRESVEDSFRYHSKQQEHMTLDLLEKMRELQAAGSSTADQEVKQSISANLNVSIVERLQDLSALLVKQTQELEETLSAKTRQICQLRWELLHRDLSTAKLETELHTHTAHRKRSKYAHFRSHSSEEASSVPQHMDCSKPSIVTDVYYTAVPSNEFHATELTNTVQQLNREVLRLATGAEQSLDGSVEKEVLPAITSSEGSRTKKISQSKAKGKVMQIVVRRSSADNISLTSTNDDAWKHTTTSTDSEDSSDEGYTRISCRPPGAVSCPTKSDAERLLMSYGEHPPRVFAQRRKKVQKVSRCNSSPGRRRANTFHINRGPEKQNAKEHAPQKCQSFRLMRERYAEDFDVRNNVSDPTLNIRNLPYGIRYKDFMKNKSEEHESGNLPKSASPKTDLQTVESLVKDTRKWLREVASDSKIPFLRQVPVVEGGGKYASKYPSRSMSDKHRRETAAERREHFQKKRCKKRLTSPELAFNGQGPLNEDAKVNGNLLNYAQCKKQNSETAKSRMPNQSSRQEESTRNLQQDCKSTNAAATTVTIQLPRRRSSKTTEAVAEQTFTIVVPKKRSLSSDIDSTSESPIKEISNSNTCVNTTLRSSTDPHLYRDFESVNRLNTRSENINTNTSIHLETDEQHFSHKSGEMAKGNCLNEPLLRKRKADDGDSSPKNSVPFEETTNITTDKEILFNSPQSSHRDKNNTTDSQNVTASGYIKSPSAPQLDWRKTCAKKVSREGAPNVRTLIEKYNRVVESQTSKSPFSSNVSSPAPTRKVSSPPHIYKTEPLISRPFCSTPTTPSIVSASTFYNPLIFKPANLDFFPKTPPASPMSLARSEALRKAKEEFITSENSNHICFQNNLDGKEQKSENILSAEENSNLTETSGAKPKLLEQKRPEEDRISNSSMDSMSLVVFRTGESCQESRLARRVADCPKADAYTSEDHSLKTSKSLSNSSIFRTVLSSDFKMPATLLRLRRSKRKKDMATVNHLCRQSLLLSTENSDDVPTPASHKSCPSSPELKSKVVPKPNWFHRNIFRHK